MIIVYCEACGVRVPDEELHSGTARKTETGAYLCKDCVQKTAPVVAAAGERVKSSARRMEPARPATATHPQNPHARNASSSRRQDSHTGMYVGLGVAAAALIAGVFAFGGKSNSEREPKQAAAPGDVKPPTPALSSPPPSDSPAETAARLLAEAKDIKLKDPALYRDKLELIASRFRGTAASAEAATLLASAQPATPAPPPPVPAPAPAPVVAPAPPAPIPPAPAPIAERPNAAAWTPIFDGKTTACLDPETVANWKADNGALVSTNTEGSYAQSHKDFADGAIRFRFELGANTGELRFSVRQGANHSEQIVDFNKASCATLAGKVHELVFTCNQNTVTAKLDGQPAAIQPAPVISNGRFRFAVVDGSLRVLAIDYHPSGK